MLTVGEPAGCESLHMQQVVVLSTTASLQRELKQVVTPNTQLVKQLNAVAVLTRYIPGYL